MKNLYCDLAVQRSVSSAVDGRHTADAKEFLEEVRPNGIARGRRRRDLRHCGQSTGTVSYPQPLKPVLLNRFGLATQNPRLGPAKFVA